jgi:hypothetical protein
MTAYSQSISGAVRTTSVDGPKIALPEVAAAPTEFPPPLVPTVSRFAATSDAGPERNPNEPLGAV